MKTTILIQHSTGQITVGTADNVKALYSMAEAIIIKQGLINPNIIIRKTAQL